MRLNERIHREAIETNENIDHAAVGETDVVVDGIELAVEGHLLPALGAFRLYRLLKE